MCVCEVFKFLKYLVRCSTNWSIDFCVCSIYVFNILKYKVPYFIV